MFDFILNDLIFRLIHLNHSAIVLLFNNEIRTQGFIFQMIVRPPKLTKEQIMGLAYKSLTFIPFSIEKKGDRDLHIRNTIIRSYGYIVYLQEKLDVRRDWFKPTFNFQRIWHSSIYCDLTRQCLMQGLNTMKKEEMWILSFQTNFYFYSFYISTLLFVNAKYIFAIFFVDYLALLNSYILIVLKSLIYERRYEISLEYFLQDNISLEFRRKQRKLLCSPYGRQFSGWDKIPLTYIISSLSITYIVL